MAILLVAYLIQFFFLIEIYKHLAGKNIKILKIPDICWDLNPRSQAYEASLNH